MKSLRIHYRNLFFCILFASCVIAIIILTCSSKHQQSIAPFREKFPNKDTRHAQPLKQSGSSHVKAESNVSSPHLRNQRKEEKHSDIQLRKFLQDLTDEVRCPACFGYEVCEEMNVEFIKLTSDEPVLPQSNSQFKVFKGRVGNLQTVFVKVPTSVRKFDESVCFQDAKVRGLNKMCNFLPSIIKSLPFVTVTYSAVSNMRSKLELHPQRVPLLQCHSSKLEDIMSNAFDYNEDKVLNSDEQKMLYTSLVLAPEIVASKVFTKIGMNSAFPRLVGTCGHSFIYEGGLKPLSLFLDKPFIQRVALAAQLISHVQNFLDGSGDWLLVLPRWELEDISVNEDSEAVFTGIQNFIVTPKSTTEESSKVCDRECIYELQERLSSTSSENSCFTKEEASHLMFSNLCLMLLSDMKQHKFRDYFSKSSSSRLHHRSWLGLLHTIPDNEKQDIELFLSTCVDETSPGERLVAAEDLQDLLADILEEEDVDYDDLDEEEEDEEDEEEEDPNDVEESEKGVGEQHPPEAPKGSRKEEY